MRLTPLLPGAVSWDLLQGTRDRKEGGGKGLNKTGEVLQMLQLGDRVVQMVILDKFFLIAILRYCVSTLQARTQFAIVPWF